MTLTTARTAPRVVLLNPGPVNTHERVKAAIGSPDECHREPEAQELLATVARKVTAVSGGGDTHAAVLLTGSGTAALEAAVSSVVPADGRLLVLDNGHYGERLLKIAEVHRIPVLRLEFGWARPIDLDAVDRALAADPGITHVAAVHHETSTGMLNPVGELGRAGRPARPLPAGRRDQQPGRRGPRRRRRPRRLVHRHRQQVPGGPARHQFRRRPPGTLRAARRRPRPDLLPRPARPLHLPGRQPHTPVHPGPAGAARPRRGPRPHRRRGVAARRKRYTERADAIRAGLLERGVDLLLPPEHRASSITNAHLSNGMTYDELHDGLKQHGYVIYATQEKSAGVFRLANMGQLTADDITGFFAAYDEVVRRHTTPRSPSSPAPAEAAAVTR
ncbi:aminotransferase [Kitasatospora arboriphila]